MQNICGQRHVRTQRKVVSGIMIKNKNYSLIQYLLSFIQGRYYLSGTMQNSNVTQKQSLSSRTSQYSYIPKQVRCFLDSICSCHHLYLKQGFVFWMPIRPPNSITSMKPALFYALFHMLSPSTHINAPCLEYVYQFVHIFLKDLRWCLI